jgi:hypothetical protein
VNVRKKKSSSRTEIEFLFHSSFLKLSQIVLLLRRVYFSYPVLYWQITLPSSINRQEERNYDIDLLTLVLKI